MAFNEYTEAEIRTFLGRFCQENGQEMTEKVHQGLATVAAEERHSTPTGEIPSDPKEILELSSTKRKRATTGRGASAANNKKKQPATRRKRAASKRHKPGQMTCMFCYSDYNRLENDDKRACRSHHGRIEVNNAQGYWDALGCKDLDTVERSDENLKQNPLGFKWTCCNRKGSSKGCRLRAHAGMRSFGSLDAPAKPTARKDNGESASEASICDTASEAES